MRNYVDDIVKNTVGQIKYRESITLGEIKTDNGDGTYGVEISQSGKTYPNVETAHYGDTFAVGEIAIITYEYGNKEMPRIWGHAKKIAQEPVEVEVDYSGSGGDPITTVTTLDAYSKTSNSAYLEGKIELSNGAGNCTRRGFKYGLTTAYDSDTHDDGDYGEGYFNKQITGLDDGETYHYKAYVLDADDNEQVGEDKVMVTAVSNVPKIFVVYKKTSDSKYYLVGISPDDSVTAIAELAELATGTAPELVRILTDSNRNVYALKQTESGLDFVHTIYKYNSSGVLQVTKVLAENEMFGFITSDYLYTMISNDDEIHKRNLSDLETVDTINLTNGHRYYYLCFDSNGYLYTYDRDYPGEAAFIKWEVGVGISEYHQNGQSSISAWADFALLGTNIAHDYLLGQYMATLATSLTSDLTVWTMNDIPTGQACGVASDTTYWYVLGENTADDKLIVEKYNSSKVLQNTIEITSDYESGKYYSAITAYPF